jgi:predicted amidohydrolase
VAAQHGVDWVLSGELVVSGYGFQSVIGTDWIESSPSRWLDRYARLCAELDITGFVSEPERMPEGLFNTAWAIGRDGQFLGSHRKLSPTPGSEDWSSAGSELTITQVDGLRVGMLMCADAYLLRPAQMLSRAGADLFVSLAAWWPGPYGPHGEWEARSRETGVPMIVCNRTGIEPVGDLTGAVSAVVADGQRLLELKSPTSTLFLVDLAPEPDRSGAVTARLADVVPVILD